MDEQEKIAQPSQSAPVALAVAIDIPFYTIEKGKLIALSLCSFNLFMLVWFYRNWKVFRDRDKDDVSPFWRSIFCGIFCFSFFQRVKNEFDRRKLEFGLEPSVLGIAILGSGMLSRLPGLWFLIAMAAVIPVVMVNEKLAELNLSDRGEPTEPESITIGQWAVIIFGGLLLFFGLLGALAGK
jgi:hypothetical protein